MCVRSLLTGALFYLLGRYQNSDTEYETPKGYHHPDSYYDDDEQPLYRDSRRSPKRRLLPATPQGFSLPSFLTHSTDYSSLEPYSANVSVLA